MANKKVEVKEVVKLEKLPEVKLPDFHEVSVEFNQEGLNVLRDEFNKVVKFLKNE